MSNPSRNNEQASPLNTATANNWEQPQRQIGNKLQKENGTKRRTLNFGSAMSIVIHSREVTEGKLYLCNISEETDHRTKTCRLAKRNTQKGMACIDREGEEIQRKLKNEKILEDQVEHLDSQHMMNQ